MDNLEKDYKSAIKEYRKIIKQQQEYFDKESRDFERRDFEREQAVKRVIIELQQLQDDLSKLI